MIIVVVVAVIVGISVYVWKQVELSIQYKIHSTEESRHKEELANAEWFAKGKERQITQLEQTIEELQGALARRKRKEAA